MGQEWRVRAACRGTEGESVEAVKLRLALFFPADDPPLSPPSQRVLQTFKVACKFCEERCEVRRECAEYARETHQYYGVWGGMHGRTLVKWVRGNKRRANAREEVQNDG